jgi:hypothetical protein
VPQRYAVCFLVWAATCAFASSSTSADAQILEQSISGRQFLAIQAAIPELERNKLDVTGYQIAVSESGTSVFVTFDNPNRPQGYMGCWGKLPCFSVELGKDDLRIIRAHFVR